MKRLTKTIVSSLAAAALVSTMVVVPGAALAAGSYTAPAAGSLTGQTAVVYTGNLNGDVAAMAKAATIKADYEAAGAVVVLADTGNFYQGSKYTAATRGKIATQALKESGYDVVAIGAREFYYGNGALGAKAHGDYREMGTITENLADAGIAGVSSNVTGDNASFAFAKNKQEGDVGFVALSDPDIPDTVLEESIDGLTFASGVGTAEAQVQELKGTDPAPKHIVALSNLAADPAVAGADAVVNTPAGAGEVAGAVVFDAAGNVSRTEIDLAGVEPDATAAAAIKTLTDAVDAEYPSSVNNTTLFQGSTAAVRGGETNTGDLWTDALVWFANNDETAKAGLESNGVDAKHVVAVWNGGNLRDYIYPGEIILQDIERTLPYPNQVHIVYLTGAQLLETLESAYQALPYDAADADNVAQNAAFLNVSGMKVELDTSVAYDKGDATGNWFKANSITRTKILEVNGQEFDENAKYAIATSNAIANGMDSNYVIKDLVAEEKLVKTTTNTKVVQAVWGYITSANGLNGDLTKYTVADTRLAAAIASAKVAAKQQTYTGKALKPAVTVTLGGKTLKRDTDYTVAYSKNTNIGTAAITVTGTGSYAGTAKGSFKIVAPVVKASKITNIAVGKKKMTVTVKKVSGATAYKVQYKAKGAKKWKTKIAKKAKVTIKKLEKGKRYQVKVTAQKKVAKLTFSAKASQATTSKKIK